MFSTPLLTGALTSDTGSWPKPTATSRLLIAPLFHVVPAGSVSAALTVCTPIGMPASAEVGRLGIE